MRYFLGVDVGGTTTKASVYDETGRELSSAGAFTALQTPRSGYAQIDMDDLWATVCSAIRRAVTASSVPPAQIACVACCGHGKGLYLWGRDGRPAFPGINSADNRAWQYPLRWQADGTEQRIFPLSNQHILAGQPVSLLAWLRDEQPQVLAQSRYIFSCKDYIRFRLTGEAFLELTDASGCNLVNLSSRTYDRELLRLLGLEPCLELLPPLRGSCDLCGRVTDEAADATGLAAGTPVAGGAFDIDACAVAARVFDDRNVCMIAGSWSINEYVADAPILDGKVLMNSCFCVPGRYLVEECSPTSAGNLEWFIDTCLPELRRQSEAQGESVYDLANRWAASLEGERVPLFLPFLLGSNVHPLASGAFLGLHRRHTRAHLIRAVYEGIAFSHRYHYEKLRKTMARPPETIRLAGGAARSPVWIRIFADVMQRPVEVMAGQESGTLGCAILAAAAVGAYDTLPAAAASMSRIAARVEPDPAAAARYDRQYALYCRAAEQLEPLWADLVDSAGQ